MQWRSEHLEQIQIGYKYFQIFQNWLISITDSFTNKLLYKLIKIVSQEGRTPIFSKLWRKYQMSTIMTKRQMVTIIVCFLKGICQEFLVLCIDKTKMAHK